MSEQTDAQVRWTAMKIRGGPPHVDHPAKGGFAALTMPAAEWACTLLNALEAEVTQLRQEIQDYKDGAGHEADLADERGETIKELRRQLEQQAKAFLDMQSTSEAVWRQQLEAAVRGSRAGAGRGAA